MIDNDTMIVSTLGVEKSSQVVFYLYLKKKIIHYINQISKSVN